MKKMSKRIALLGALVAAFAVSGKMDAEDQIREVSHYCEMVESGVWPDYRGIQEKDC